MYNQRIRFMKKEEQKKKKVKHTNQNVKDVFNK